ncbi:MAG: PH domain-containing protein [Methanomassiliicoccales archaeon]|jgi:hypothetical protein
MAREFDVNEEGVTSEGYKALHPKVKTAMRVGTLIFLAISLALLALTIIFGDELVGYFWPLLLLFVLITAIAIVDLTIVPIVFYARYRYNVGEDRIDVLRGVLTIRHTVVPIERIHQVEVTRGPINNMFGLANVTITTAGGISSIEYLELSEAESIADRLNEKIVSILKERE